MNCRRLFTLRFVSLFYFCFEGVAFDLCGNIKKFKCRIITGWEKSEDQAKMKLAQAVS